MVAKILGALADRAQNVDAALFNPLAVGKNPVLYESLCQTDATDSQRINIHSPVDENPTGFLPRFTAAAATQGRQPVRFWSSVI